MSQQPTANLGLGQKSSDMGGSAHVHREAARQRAWQTARLPVKAESYKKARAESCKKAKAESPMKPMPKVHINLDSPLFSPLFSFCSPRLLIIATNTYVSDSDQGSKQDKAIAALGRIYASIPRYKYAHLGSPSLLLWSLTTQ